MIFILILLLNIGFSNGKESNGIDWKKKPTFSSTPVDIDLTTSKLLLRTKAEWRSDLVVNFKDSRASDAGSFQLEFSKPPKYGFIERAQVPALQTRSYPCPSQNQINLVTECCHAGVTTKPELPVKHGVNVKLKCPKRTVNMGGDTGVCVDGVVLASSGSPVCVSDTTSKPETTAHVTKPAQSVTGTPAKPIDWTKKPSRGMKIDFSTTKLLLKTKAKTGDTLRLNFEDSRGSSAGEFGLDFSSSPKYDFSKCTALSVSRASSKLKQDLPKPDEGGYRVFEVMKYGKSGRGLKISCNGVELITFEPSDDVCKGWSFWKSTWEKKKAKVTFTFDDVIQYVATVPYRKEKKDRYITSV